MTWLGGGGGGSVRGVRDAVGGGEDRDAGPADPLRGLISGHRPRDEEALDEVAAERAETLARLDVLDALRNNSVAQPVSEVDGGAHDRRARFVVQHAEDE